jgi:hypothetical protein
MGNIFPGIREANTEKELLQNLIDAYSSMTKKLEFWFQGNLDDDFIRSITTDKLIAGTAKIGTALIDELIVGTNVGLGTAKDEAGVTTIVGGLITTDFIAALGLTVGTHINMGTALPATTFSDFIIGTYASDLNAIQSQIDGNITSWFYDGAPTLSNQPALIWDTDAKKDVHLGDLYYDNLTGYAYRFRKNGSIYEWFRITDTDIVLALTNAAHAQDTADSKRRNFTSQPLPPYDIGDTWTDGNDIRKCNVQRLTGAYNAADWGLATNYTNPTGVTTIVGGVVTTDFVNALGVIAGSVAAENIFGTYITGKTVRTAASGARIELTNGNVLRGYNSSGLLHGLYAAPGSFSDLLIYRSGSEIFQIYDDITVIDIKTLGHTILSGSNTTAYPYGTWNFTNATVTNLSAVAKFG